MNLDLYFIIYTKVNLKWIIGLTERSKSINHLNETIGENLCDLVIGKGFLILIKHKLQKKEIDRLNSFKFKSFCSSKEAVRYANTRKYLQPI